MNAPPGIEEALALHRAGRLLEAQARYEAILRADPARLDALYYLAMVLDALGRDADALAAIDRAVALRPDMGPLHVHRAKFLRALGRRDEALAGIERALALDPADAGAHGNRGLLLDELDRPDEAASSFERALALQPDLPDALHGRARWLIERGELAAARRDLERAVALAPGSDAIAFELAQLQLLLGEWTAAWPDYERRHSPQKPTYSSLPFPRWNGETPDGYRLVLVTEQGLGDAIQFARFAPWLAARGHRVTVLARPSMVALLSGLRGVTEVTEEISTPRDAAIRWAPLASLPLVLGITPQTIPDETPYLFAEPERAEAWRGRLGAHGFKIGIAWQGRPDQRLDRGRSFPLAALAPLAAIPGVRLISLQKGAGTEQIAGVAFADRIETPGEDFDSGASAFLDTAAVMTNLDLVITSDTAVAHLAGALGQPVFVALKAVPDWRFLLKRDDSPWYPTMRLFRQSAPGDWSDVFARIAEGVRARLA